MIDHLGLAVSDIDTAKAFYDAALAPLGITAMHVLDASEWGGAGKHVGYGRDGEDAFWIGDTRAATTGAHVAFTAVDEAQVQAFHAAALAAGGRDNGAPGPRPEYHPGYYGAFVLDPDGNNIEAVFHGAADAGEKPAVVA
ncbi:VOC family protein [Paracoccus marinus]|uniref:VOC family protein n=1 Tax=Paracoccus marinus TaxID=288426 RepID=UPI00103FC61D|nr:VOC family protein [Paracoccus marinus]GLS81403.1 glyoxalase [Paracoccus marinus]